MTTEPVSIAVYFDFLCPVSYRASRWIDNLQEQLGDTLQVDWRYFSLEQVNAPEDTGWYIWEQPEDYESVTGRGPRSRALLAFWSAEAARQQGPQAFDRFRKLLYRARHEDRLDFSQRANIMPIAEQAELDMQRFEHDFANRELLDILRRDHAAGAAQKVFGVPTISFNERDILFVKLMQVPPAEEAVPLFNDLRDSFEKRSWLAEIKRSDPGHLA